MILYDVLPVDEYERLINSQPDSEESWESVPYEQDEHDKENIPNDVVEVMIKHDVSLQAAWRLCCGLSQYEVAEELGRTQSAVSQLERTESKPRKKTREKLAELYGCRPEQLTL